MSYENAPATKMLASHCAVCARPLLDAESVELGIGPECRKRHGFEHADSEPDMAALVRLGIALELAATPRVAANAMVNHIARAQQGPDVGRYILALHALGYRKLAERIAQRIGTIEVSEDGDAYFVETPFSEQWNEVAHANRWRWLRDRKARRVPVRERNRLWEALKATFKGMIVRGNKGMALL